MAGGETGTILTREGIYRMQYVGAPLVFTFDKVSNRVRVRWVCRVA